MKSKTYQLLKKIIFQKVLNEDDCSIIVLNEEMNVTESILGNLTDFHDYNMESNETQGGIK